MEIESRKLRSFETKRKGMKLIFDPTIHVTKSEPTMSPMSLFSNIGGCIGLTLGYSILQVVMCILQNFRDVTEKTKRRLYEIWGVFKYHISSVFHENEFDFFLGRILEVFTAFKTFWVYAS